MSYTQPRDVVRMLVPVTRQYDLFKDFKICRACIQ